ncbi:hypothetical protein Q7272_11080 [Glaesserella parasuis]|uniref:hypothetical protein n=1 Tax=Glaesserella parasuis TaxID=738 RepID=UPI002436C598|nr:hypothetical protein [Glaesserella parasuis]MDG6374591.1 hypothetical protein [Glaesserella parasuis]MDP0333846.1 hypothetical protein [Glaesserella parasuis]
MNELLDLDTPKPKICLEIEFDTPEALQKLSFSAGTKVLGGLVSRVDFQGEVFDECDFYRELLDGEQITFLLSRNQIEEVKDLIFVELKSIIDDIKFEEELARYDEEETM